MTENLHYLNRATHHYNGACFVGLNVPDQTFHKVSSTDTIWVDRSSSSQLRDTDRRLTAQKFCCREKNLEFCEFLWGGVRQFLKRWFITHVVCACLMCLCASCVCRYPQSPEEAVSFPGTGVLVWVLELNLGPLQGQQALNHQTSPVPRVRPWNEYSEGLGLCAPVGRIQCPSMVMPRTEPSSWFKSVP